MQMLNGLPTSYSDRCLRDALISINCQQSRMVCLLQITWAVHGALRIWGQEAEAVGTSMTRSALHVHTLEVTASGLAVEAST